MISTASVLPSPARALRANSARNRTARGVPPDRFRRASAREDNDEASSIVILKKGARRSKMFVGKILAFHSQVISNYSILRYVKTFTNVKHRSNDRYE